MKRRKLERKAGSKLAIMTAIMALGLVGCASEDSLPEVQESSTGQETVEKESAVQGTDEKEAAIQETMVSDKTTEFDVQTELQAAEEQAAALEKKLKEDASLSQADMNDLSYEIYTVWDDTLNNIWKALKDSLDKDTMDGLLEEQRAWITEKEKEIKQAGEDAGGGSLAIYVSNQRAAKLTKTRVYELANYLGYVGNDSESE